MLKFGGEKALTKREHDSVESTLKCQLPIENVCVDLDVHRVVEDNVARMCSHEQVLVEQEPKLKVAHAVKKRRVKRSSRWGKLGKIMDKLYNIEPENENETEKSLKIELNLYQMENY